MLEGNKVPSLTNSILYYKNFKHQMKKLKKVTLLPTHPIN